MSSDNEDGIALHLELEAALRLADQIQWLASNHYQNEA